MILGIDASTPGSGGAKRHLIELLASFSPSKHRFEYIIIWGVKENLDKIPDYPWLVKISHPFLNKSLFFRIIWQLFLRDRDFHSRKLDILFSPFGTYNGSFNSFISMSRNMLIFEETERRRFGISWMYFKLLILKYVQSKSFNKAKGIIFLSEHAKKVVNRYIDYHRKNIAVINHGVSESFKNKPKTQHPIGDYSFDKPYRLLYVSAIWVYKHPWVVVNAVYNLRLKGYPLVLDIVGSAEQRGASQKLQKVISKVNAVEEFVFWHQGVGLNEVASFYKQSDAFVFASTCENMPNILIEAMSSGLPILCSDYQPMPEFLDDAGVYFNPLSVESVESVLTRLLLDVELRTQIAAKSYNRSLDYTWQKCADATFGLLYQTIKINK